MKYINIEFEYMRENCIRHTTIYHFLFSPQHFLHIKILHQVRPYLTNLYGTRGRRIENVCQITGDLKKKKRTMYY